MLKPRTAVVLVIIGALSIYTCFSISGVCVDAQAQQETASDDTTQGVRLYKQGDKKGAIKVLRTVVKQHKDDAIAWYYLGLALNGNGDTKESRKAFETTVKLRPDFATAHAALAYILLLTNKTREAVREAERALALDSQIGEAHYVISVARLREGEAAKGLNEVEIALKLKPDFTPAYLLKSELLLAVHIKKTIYKPNQSPEERVAQRKEAAALFREAADSLEKYIQLTTKPSEANIWREQLESLRVYAQGLGNNDTGTENPIFRGDALTTKARILKRPEPQYTESARSAQISGTVIMRAVFAADGTVKNILVLQSLPFGLTEQAVKAARKIKFIPATKDGRAVSQFIQIEYNFNLY
jgi:TonB family protein